MFRRALVVVFTLVPLLAAPAADPLKPGTHKLTVTAEGHDWACHVHVPKKYDPAKPPPLVLLLHGAGGTGDKYLSLNGWADKADAEGFVVAAPTGLSARPKDDASFATNPRVWNSGQLVALSPRAKIDDVKFFEKVLDDLAKSAPYNPKAVFVTGHSNGAGMTFMLGAKLSERLTALAPFAGMLAVKDPKPTKPLPTLYIVGTKDPLQPVEGGEVTLPWGGPPRKNPPVSEYLEGWSKALGGGTEAKTVSDKDGVKTVEYPPNKDGVGVRAIFIEGHGHGWPGGKESGLPEKLIGPDAKKLNATDVIWGFFKSHLPK